MTLKEDVKRIVWESAKEYDNDMEGFLRDLADHGCSSGMVGEMVYYVDTLAFHDCHQDEINELLAEMLNETGFKGPSEFFMNWDECAPLGLGTQNRNLLAWFGFEETAARYSQEFIDEWKDEHEEDKDE